MVELHAEPRHVITGGAASFANGRIGIEGRWLVIGVWMRRIGGRDFIDAIKKCGTTAGHSFDDPASHREPSVRDEASRVFGYSRGSLWRPIQDIGRIPAPAMSEKATQRPAERDMLRGRLEPVFQGLARRFGPGPSAARARWRTGLRPHHDSHDRHGGNGNDHQQHPNGRH